MKLSTVSFRWPARLLGVVALLAAVACVGAPRVEAQGSFTSVAADVNKKLVKLFGFGGFKGLPGYGTGIVVSPKGHILTCNNHLMSSQELRCHLYDGRNYNCKVLFREPNLDVALIKIEEDIDLPNYYDFDKEAGRPMAEIGNWVLAHSNCFHIATRDEPMSVQRSVIAAHSELRARRGVFDAPFSGEAYFLDGIACNPGAAGGALTNRKGELLGVLGRELKSSLTDTWINYAIPIHATVEVQRKEKNVKVSMAMFVKEAIAGTYVVPEKIARVDKGGFHGIILVPNAVSVTPPYVEEVLPGSPAAKAGLRPDDLIVYVDGELIPSIRLFRDYMKGVGPGEEVRLDIQRGTKLISAKLKLLDQPKGK